MELTPTMILNLALLIVPPVALCWRSGKGWPSTSAGRLP